jgi:hypothetical protein
LQRKLDNIKARRGLAMTDQSAPDPGIFVTKGMRISIPHLSIRVGPDGAFKPEPIALHTSVDMCPVWLSIAYEHLTQADQASKELLNAKQDGNDEQIGVQLNKESSSGMQAIMASSVAMDAYYANVKECIDIPESLSRIWREKGTARYKQIAEVLRRAFVLPLQSARSLRAVMRQNTDFRDRAVHPKAGTTQPALHAELNKVTDWRYAAFRFYNAKAIVGLTFSIVVQTASKELGQGNSRLSEYCRSVMASLEPSIERWKSRYGKLSE